MREYNLVRNAVRKFNLNLEGFTVTTEAASGNYRWTCVAALMAGADHVYAVGRDSRFGQFFDVVSDIKEHLDQLSLSQSKITFLNGFDAAAFANSDIVTNSGFLRPLDQSKLKHLKQHAVIPLMFEAWEFREKELDLQYCIDHGHMVLGTNEGHTHLKTLFFIGAVVRKLLNQMDIEAFQSNILLIGEEHFADHIKKVLSPECSCDVISSKSELTKPLSHYDAIVVADMVSDTMYIGEHGIVGIEKIRSENPDIAIAHVAGAIDEKGITENNIRMMPQRIAPPLYMSATTDYVGPKPAIDLNTAGLKVGECMARAMKESGNDFYMAKASALTSSICQDFPLEILSKYLPSNS